MSNKLSKSIAIIADKQLQEQISRLNLASSKKYWKVKTNLASDGSVENRLEADYIFKTFAKTWSFLNLVAYHADSVKHHPSINTTYNKVNILLTTHDAGNKVTYNDLKFAQFVSNQFCQEFERPHNVLKLNKLLKDTREQFSLSQASQIIDDLVASNKTPVEKTENHPLTEVFEDNLERKN